MIPNDMNDGSPGAELSEINGWNYDFSSLPLWTLRVRNPWCTHKLIEDNEHDNACLLYGIIEERMGSYLGYCAIFQNKSNPLCVAALPKIKVWLAQPTFSKDGRFVLLLAHYQGNGVVLILNIRNKTFALVDLPISTPVLNIIETDTNYFSFQASEVQMKDNLIRKTCKKTIRIDKLSFESWDVLK
ncbi:MAG: hypothetical protein KBT31_03535 [Firmicutes bacterium]|nr:hypothetical protein [Candidatus Colimorpha enterica]